MKTLDIPLDDLEKSPTAMATYLRILDIRIENLYLLRKLAHRVPNHAFHDLHGAMKTLDEDERMLIRGMEKDLYGEV